MTEFPYLSESDVASLLRYDELVPAMAQALLDYSAGKVIQPVRQLLAVEPQRRYFAAMTAVAADAMGAKLVSFYPANEGSGIPTHLASIMLFDPKHGLPLACMDGRLITEMRTAATSVAVTRVAARPDSKILALLGSGVQALAHLQALRQFYAFDEVRVWSRNLVHAKAFAEAHGAVATSAKDAVSGADIIVTATSASEPILRGAWIKPGAHVNAVGAPRPDWRELDDEAMKGTLIVDCRIAALAESGDVIQSRAPIHAEAGELLAGTKVVDPFQTTIFKSVGIAVEDIAAAKLVFTRYLAKGDVGRTTNK